MRVYAFEPLRTSFRRMFYQAIIPFWLASFFLGTDSWSESAPVKSTGTATLTASSTKGSKKSGSSSNRRHRRLKVRRPLKSMPPLSEAPFASEIPLLPVIEEAKSRLEKEKVSYSPGSRNQPSRREIKLALADFKTGKIQIVSGVESNQKFSLSDPGIQYRVDWWNGFNSSITILDRLTQVYLPCSTRLILSGSSFYSRMRSFTLRIQVHCSRVSWSRPAEAT